VFEVLSLGIMATGQFRRLGSMIAWEQKKT